MKKIQLLLICLPILFSCGGNKKNNHLEGLKGKVKEITITTSNVKEYFGDIVSTDIKEKIKLKYNEDGYTLEKFKIDKNGELKWKWEFIYNEDGRWIEMHEYKLNNFINGELKFITKYKHDEDGNHIEADIYNTDKAVNYNKIKNKEFDGKWKCKYDEGGNKIEANYYNKDGELIQKNNYRYDEDGNEITETINHTWVSKILTSDYRYDEDGNLIAEADYIMEELDYKADLEEKFSYEYDKFDKENNWLKQIKYNQDATPVSITEREIDYY